MGRPHPVITALRGLILAIGCAAVILPFLAVVSTSLATQEEVTANGGFVLLVRDPTFASYQAILSGGVVTRALVISILVTAVGTLLSLACTVALAYSLSRPGSLGSHPILLAVLFTMLFSPGMIPMYLVVKQLGLLDNLLALILPVLINAFNVIVMREFFLDIPGELLESARVDGANDLTILARIVLPLSRAVIAVVGLFYAVGYWNAFFNGLLYISSPEKWPLQLVLRTYVVNETPMGVDEISAGSESLPPQLSIQMAVLVLSIIPILLVYPFLQKHFTKGLMIGAVKG
ncbi:carbohydrate ABC transporter membrane protein 2, CUT1 family [Krasilnikoviella flava]|uniref:Carbohydrate ABC transporter membrane protein 2, CUT1 family n=1 Tax=Krasilnikoviella flava TaxID=526729 RepID=A0A1T5IMQ9_9MICO|nr:carbohydrate ABC transporter membrane protein 2, CUT1 family [Krasilnikoviella flava]